MKKMAVGRRYLRDSNNRRGRRSTRMALRPALGGGDESGTFCDQLVQVKCGMIALTKSVDSRCLRSTFIHDSHGL
jgi:hypothetical protein